MTHESDRLLAALRAAVEAPGDDYQARNLLMPRLLDGTPARPAGPPPDTLPRIGAVLALIYPRGDDLMIPLTVRSDRLSNHSGEVSLPGGSSDPEDPDLAWTALREAEEELGIEPQSVELWGSLTPVYIRPSNFQITPFVGYSPSAPDLRPHAAEVAAVFELPLRYLVRPDIIVVEEWVRRDVPMQVPFYPFMGYKIWGATGIILSQLAARLAPVYAGRGTGSE